MNTNAKRKIDGRVESQLIALRCSEAPAGSSRWTLRLLASKMVELGHVESMSYQSADNILKKVQSNPGA